MKRLKYLAGILGLALGLLSCEDDWNNHYSQNEAVINNSEVTIVKGTLQNYLHENYSSQYKLFDETGMFETMKVKKQPLTILVLDNTILDTIDFQDKEVWAKTYVSDVALSPSGLKDGQKILMWSKKYLSFSVSDTIEAGATTNLAINDVKVKKIIKTDDGYIYEIGKEITVYFSLYETVKRLGNDYSEFKRLLFKFNKAASKPIGIDSVGNTIYDSVFLVSSPAGFDLTSEAISATMLIPSNEVIRNALNNARQSLKEWQMERADSIIENWIYQSVFFTKAYTADEFVSEEDQTSAYSKQWRTTVQKVDWENQVKMSNGVAYFIEEMKIPNNVLMYRLKDFFKWYEYLSVSDKEKYYKETNLTFKECKTDITAWSGWPGVFPNIEHRILIYTLKDSKTTNYTLEFTPYKYVANSDGSHTAEPYLIPPGEYTLSMGFKQNTKMDVEIFLNGKSLKKVSTADLTSTTWHYDRGGTGYPEGYDTKLATHSKKSNYDRDGGKVTDIVISVESGAEAINLTLKGTNVKGDINLHHWCLRPTKNNY